MRITRVAVVGLVVAALAGAPAAARAQKAGGMQFGPWVGLNFATLSATDLAGVTFSSRTGIIVGGQLQKALSPNFSLRLGAFYSMRGAKADEAGVSATFKANYIEIPVSAMYTFSMQGSKLAPYLLAGGQFGIKASCDVESGGTTTDCNTALGGNVTSTDIGLNFGGGVAFPAGKGSLTVDARYYLGFTNLISSVSSTSKLKNAGFTVGVGYMIPFGR